MLWLKNLLAARHKESTLSLKKSPYSVIFSLYVCTVGNVEVQPTTEASKRYDDITRPFPLVNTDLRGVFYSVIFKFYIMTKKKLEKCLRAISLNLQIELAANRENPNGCILKHQTLLICFENTEFLLACMRQNEILSDYE